MSEKRIEEPKLNAEDLSDIVRKIQIEILAQREEILTAFIAKYGANPEDVIQVINYSRLNEGVISWHIERRSK